MLEEFKECHGCGKMMPTKQNASYSLTNKENLIGDNIIWHRSNVICKLLEDNSIFVENDSEEFDATVVYGGRGTGGYFSNGMEPGKTYNVSVQVELIEDLIQPTSRRALTIRVDIKYSDKIHWGAIHSKAAPQTQGIYNLKTEFTVPRDAIGCWISLQLGAGHKSGAIWRKFQITQKESSPVLKNIYNLDENEISLANWDGLSFKYQDTIYSETEITYLEKLLRKENKDVPILVKEYILGLSDAILDSDCLLKDVISENKKIGIEYPGYFNVKENNYLT